MFCKNCLFLSSLRQSLLFLSLGITSWHVVSLYHGSLCFSTENIRRMWWTRFPEREKAVTAKWRKKQTILTKTHTDKGPFKCTRITFIGYHYLPSNFLLQDSHNYGRPFITLATLRTLLKVYFKTITNVIKNELNILFYKFQYKNNFL